MNSLRRFLTLHPSVGSALLALALSVKLLVPAGYMPERAPAGVVLAICSGSVPSAHPAMAGAHHHHMADRVDHPDRPCPYADLTLAALASADPILPAPITAFVERRHHSLAAARAPPLSRLRPPPRGPPLLA